MTRVYLIRHGEAEGNIYRRAHGHYDGHITAKGKRQIQALAERFRDEQIDALYSSDLSRTVETAGAISKYHDLEIQLEPRLREISMGAWEDVPWGNLTYSYPEMMSAFNNDPDRFRAEGAETFSGVRQRMTAIVLALAARHDGQTIVCVSHGMAIRSFLAGILGVSSEEIYKVPHGDNTSVALLEIENGKTNIVYYNDNSHLTGDLSTFARQTWWKKALSHDDNNLRFEPLDPGKEPELYKRLYAETWQAVHGSLSGFSPEPYLENAKRHCKKHPEAILKAIKGDKVVGVTELDLERGRNEGYGWISLCYVDESERRKLLGVQLIGHAVSVFRNMGYSSIRLNVFSGNTGAIAFYEEYGFHAIGSSDGVLGKLLVMEKELI